jgi:pimeloyl-ACP methyl ester carboxylesterase
MARAFFQAALCCVPKAAKFGLSGLQRRRGWVLRAALVILFILFSLGVLEVARHGVGITQSQVGQTPVTEYARPDPAGPVVVVAHGFAGPQQMMQDYTPPLAQAGHRVFVFEFLGHGRNPLPMSGDVTSVDGTTRLLVDQTAAVIDAVAPEAASVALLGHSIATDALVRVAAERSDIGPHRFVAQYHHEAS